MLKNNYHAFISAIIITGGYPSSNYRSVEILRENGSYWCSLPDLPNERYSHVQSGLIACGGGGHSTSSAIRKSCLTFSSGQWTKSHELQILRYRGSGWMSPEGLILLGGYGQWYTSEMLTDDGDTKSSFSTHAIW